MREACATEAFGGIASTTPRRAKQRSVFYDTRKRGLRADGLSLAIRETSDGRVQVLTCEPDGLTGDGASGVCPGVLACATDGKVADIDAITDKAWRHRLEKAVSGEPLVAVYELSVDRVARELSSAAGDLIELELDTGRIAAGKRKEGFRLARMTLKSGNPTALLDLASRVVGDGRIEISPSTAQRAYRLADSKRAAKVVSVKAGPSPVVEDMTAAEAMSAVVGSIVAQIDRNWQAVELSDDPDAVHQLRVGLRRLRSALRIVRRAIDDQHLRTIGDQARDLAASVGRLRDVDVLLSDIVAPLAGKPQVCEGLSELRRLLAAERGRLREAVLQALTSREASLFRIELEVLQHLVAHAGKKDDKHLPQPVTQFADKSLRKLLERVSKRGRRLDELTLEERHELRKAMKSLRYGIEFFAPLYPQGKIRHLQEAASELQDVLGYLNDVALAERLLTYSFADGTRSEAMSQAIGAVVGWHAAQAEHAWESAKSAWKHFNKQSTVID